MDKNQEVLMPLSPECFLYVCNDIAVDPGSISDTKLFPSDVSDAECPHPYPETSYENVTPVMQVPEVLTTVPDPAPMASLPAIKNWPGDWYFDVLFENENVQKRTTGSSWTYSAAKDKLYVKKDEPCPIKFVTKGKGLHAPNATIRAVMVFAQAQFALDEVTRCITHMQKDSAQGSPLANFVLRSRSLGAVYEEDSVTKRCSVVVPYENPQVGATDTTYIYSFGCWSSCVGGINRRLLKIVFTLEYGSTVVGRRTLDLRICASPYRDRLTEENKFLPKKPLSSSTTSNSWQDNQKPGSSGQKQTSKKYFKEEDVLAALFEVPQGPPLKKKANLDSSKFSQPDPPYVITTDDHGMYRFLKKMHKLATMHNNFVNLSPSAKQLLLQSGTKSESSEERRTSEESD